MLASLSQSSDRPYSKSVINLNIMHKEKERNEKGNAASVM
jgi:hypothetical protein